MKIKTSNKQKQNKAFITEDYIMQSLNSLTSGSDPLGRYYTSGLVGRTLVREMNLDSPNLVVDLGTGDGSLSAEAAQIWTSTKFITVDIDHNVTEVNNNRLKHTSSIHYTSDVLNSNLHDRIGLNLGSADGAVCNPPYIRPRWRKDFGDILEDAGLSGILTSIKDVSADVLFIAQNLRLLRNDGRLGLILPDGIIAGEKYSKLRELLITEHRVERVIELPRRIFRKTDAKAHIVILTKNGLSNETVSVERLDANGTLASRILVPAAKAIYRMDYSYLESQAFEKKSSNILLGDIYEALTRGQLSSTQVKRSNINIFHSTNFPLITNSQCPDVPQEFILKKQISGTLKTTIAESGDILICRVGRNLERKICYVQKGFVALSDCVYKLRVKPEYRKQVKEFLSSNSGEKILSGLAHGVGAKYLSKEDLINIIIDR